MILLGWYRFVCSNGLVIGESKIEIKERHKQGLELASIGWRLRQALASVEADCVTMKNWQVEKVVIDDIATWANERVSEHWGIKAAARIFHICDSGQDSEIKDPFAPGAACRCRRSLSIVIWYPFTMSNSPADHSARHH
jgi:hypothetical protein